MKNVKSMGYEDNLDPGVAVVFGEKEGFAALPGTGGSGVPCGVYSSVRNGEKTLPDSQDSAPITRMGLARVVAGSAVKAGDFGYVDGTNGELKPLPETAGTYWVYGQFEEDGDAGDYVDFNVNIGQITVEGA